MPTPKVVGGYAWRSAIARGRSAERETRRHIQRILEEQPGRTLTAAYLAEMLVQLGIIADALGALEKIADETGAEP